LDRGYVLDQRRWGRLGRLIRCCGGPCTIASPHETSTLVISHWVHVEDFILQVVEVVVIKVEASFQRTVRYSPLAFEEVNDLGENVIEGHRRPSTALASAISYP
jgi:hypothetical protein